MKKKLIVTLGAAGLALAAMTACSNATSTNTNRANTPTANAMTANPVNSSLMTNGNIAKTDSDNPMVGGAPMLKTKDIIDNAVNSKDHTTLVTAVKAAGLVETLKGAGPFTVFAPTNGAFEKLPKGTVETLVKPESKTALTKILTYHVVAGNMDSKAIAKAIEQGKGTATFKTVSGGILAAAIEGKDLILTDEKGGKSKVTIADVMQSNGVIHVVDTVLMPK